MKKGTKIEVRDLLSLYIDSDIFSGSLEEVAKNILDLKNRAKNQLTLLNKNPDTYSRFDILFEQDRWDNGDMNINLYGIRIETEEEFNIRIEKKKKENELTKQVLKEKENKEYATFLRLKEKYKNENR